MIINPEKNPRTRAVLYVIGVGGLIHLITLLVIAITKGDLNYFHPLYTVDIDQLWQGSHNNYIVYVGGWLVFFTLIYFVHKAIKKEH